MREILGRFRRLFLYAALFSLVMNLLMLMPAVYMLQIFDRVLAGRSNETLVLLTGSVGIALLVMLALDVLRARLFAAGGLLLDRRLGPSVVQSLYERARRPGGAEQTGGLSDVAALRSFLTGPAVLALVDSPWVPVYLVVIFLFHPLLGAVALGGALLMLTVTVVNERLTRAPIELLQTQGRRAGRLIEAGLRNAEVVSALGIAGDVTRRWQARNDEVLALQHEASRRTSLTSGLTRFLRQSLQVVMLGVGAYLVIDKHVSSGIMIAATVLLGRALAPVETLIAGWKSLVDARAALHRLEAVVAARERAETTPLPAPAGHLVLDRVVFGMKGRERPIITSVSLELQPGQSLGIIGPSASGKSTLARLAIGVWEPAAGKVRIDGSDLATWPRERIGPFIGYLPQNVELFAGTVAENIARLGAVDAEAVVEAAKLARAHEMILRLPEGYDTQVGDDGALLAGGQRQRIALARALYGDLRLAVLDEPTAHLDAEGEEALAAALRDLKAKRVTTLLITHRPSLLQNADIDKVMVLKAGAVELLGARSEVVARVTRGALAVAGQIGRAG
ncbi:MAG TPA: type I secretion system permease/ATPase [Burkholderiales bacterium]|nr:type I secretion system permease/ATPase [Burkholderiales bacterium]